MYIVTGGAGFIGSNIVKELNDRGITNILVVDNFYNSEKFRNLVGLHFSDYMDKRAFLDYLKGAIFNKLKLFSIREPVRIQPNAMVPI